MCQCCNTFNTVSYTHLDVYKRQKKAIVKWIELTDEKILLIGLNSNYKIDYEGGLGHINPDSLEEEMKILYEKFPNHSRIVIFHHNIISFYEDRKTGQFEKENRVTILNMLKKYETKLILYGNEHTRASDISDNIYYSCLLYTSRCV